MREQDSQKPQLKLYAGSIGAAKQVVKPVEGLTWVTNNEVVSVHTCLSLIALSEDEALGKATRIMQERWPSEEGWQHSGGIVIEITPEQFELAGYKKNE